MKQKRNKAKKPEKEDIVDYDFSNHVYEPNYKKEIAQSQAPEPQQRTYNKMKNSLPSAPAESQVLYSTVPRVGMVYPTNHPQYPYETDGYPAPFNDDRYNPDLYDPYENRNSSQNYKGYPNKTKIYPEVNPMRERTQFKKNFKQ